jgi:hypothetical protein
MTNDLDHTNPTDQIIIQGRALVRAIEAMDIIMPTGRFERWQTRLLQAAYKYRLRGIIKAAPAWVAEQILSASESVGEDRPAVWMSQN